MKTTFEFVLIIARLLFSDLTLATIWFILSAYVAITHTDLSWMPASILFFTWGLSHVHNLVFKKLGKQTEKEATE